MGESKRRKEFEEKNLIVLPGGKGPLVRPVRRYRTVMLELPLELFELVEKLHEVSVQMTEDAPRTNEAWWELIVGKGAEVIDQHIQNMVRAALEREKDRPSIERIEATLAPGNEALLKEIKEIINEHPSGGSGREDRGGEGRASQLLGSDEGVQGDPVLGSPEAGSPHPATPDPQSAS